ncbi:MAG: MarC family protein [Rhodospirillum sp.]|nr:MarC family protein [Rhodospirillum sp.]MCF8489800.1 MarC family protein [Rhodospirillum sp.]MCF8500512.1 MarC family protein [Rhodospirillum sp.]
MSDSFPSHVATLLVLVDPIGILAIFLGLTAGRTAVVRRRVAIKGCVLATLILIAAAVGGGAFLDLVGIEIPAFRIAGGLMLLLVAQEMIFAKRTIRRGEHAQAMDKERGGEDEDSDPSVFPLAIPLIAGPGAITAVLLFSRESGGPLGLVWVIAAIVAVLAPTMVLLLAAGTVHRLMGKTLTLTLDRLLGIILGALAVQFILNGLREAFPL